MAAAGLFSNYLSQLNPDGLNPTSNKTEIPLSSMIHSVQLPETDRSNTLNCVNKVSKVEDSDIILSAATSLESSPCSVDHKTSLATDVVPESSISSGATSITLEPDVPAQDSTVLPSPSPSKATGNLSRTEECTTPMLIDPNLPPGWTRKVTQRTMGASAGKYDVYIFSPDKKKIRSKTDLMLYLAKTKLDLDPNSIDFSVRGRAHTPIKRPSQKSSAPKAKRAKTVSSLATQRAAGSETIKPNKPSGEGSGSSDQNQTPNNSGPKLIVKFNFPITRLKRTPAMKTKKPKIKSSGQDCQASEDGISDQLEYHEELSNGEARLKNGLDLEEIELDENSVPTDVFENSSV